MARHEPHGRDPIAEGRRAIVAMRRQVESAQFRADRKLGRTSEIAVNARVRVKAAARWATLADEVFTIVEVVGRDENAMVKLRASDGRFVKWFRATELLSANEETMSKNASNELMQLANKVERERRIDFRSALVEASRQRPDLAEAHIAEPDMADKETKPVSTPTRDNAADTLLSLANTIANERGMSLRTALMLAASQQPEVVSAYRDAFSTGARTNR